jgi:all-trans-retinol dehydrogenase (NAD+)
LRDRYDATRVRTICVTPNFARTKLAEGLVNRSSFMSPTLHPESVAEAIFEKITSGNGGFVILPRVHSFMAHAVRSWPWWMQRFMSTELRHTMVDVDGWKNK